MLAFIAADSTSQFLQNPLPNTTSLQTLHTPTLLVPETEEIPKTVIAAKEAKYVNAFRALPLPSDLTKHRQ